MSVSTKLLQAAAGGGSEAVYVDDVFSCFLYEGNATSRSIVNGIDLADKGGLVWTKNRDDSYDHNFVDSARGLTNSPYIRSNTAGAQGTDGNGITVFNNNGYTVGSSGSWNANGNNHVSWTFAKQEKFFDIVTYTGDGTTGRSVAHNLGSVPGMILIKNLSASESWVVYHRGIGNTKSLVLNTTAAQDTSSAYWNNTDPTATHFTLGNAGGPRNENGVSYIAYLFAHDEQEFGEDSDEAIIKCGSYTGNGSTGQFINLGFEPQFLLIKSASSTHDWYLTDVMRGMANTDDSTAHKYLYAQAVNAEEGYASRWRTEPNGFHLTTASTGINGSSNTYIYMAIRRPHKPASEFAANKLFSMDGAGNASGDPDFVSNDHVVDMAFLKLLAGTESAYLTARLTEKKYINLASNSAEASDGTLDMDFQSGFGDSASSAVANYQAWMFRRAKGFFDVVTYVGNGTTSHAVNHNLGVAPELIIVKDRTRQANWSVYHQNSPVSGSGKRYNIMLQADNAAGDSDYWPSTPTATQFVLGDSDQGVNRSGDAYIACLFATADGISKVGGYTGTGSDLNVDCGFSAGARFVLIKRTDSSGDWYVYDSVRGIVAGNDPYYFINSNAAQVTNTDYIDPLSSGFTVTSSAPAGLNASSGNYIFLAIA